MSETPRWWEYAVVTTLCIGGAFILCLTPAWPIATVLWVVAMLNGQWAYQSWRGER